MCWASCEKVLSLDLVSPSSGALPTRAVSFYLIHRRHHYPSIYVPMIGTGLMCDKVKSFRYFGEHKSQLDKILYFDGPSSIRLSVYYTNLHFTGGDRSSFISQIPTSVVFTTYIVGICRKKNPSRPYFIILLY